MATVQKASTIEPIPRYVMPDASIPDYDEILRQLQGFERSLIGSSYYYIRVDQHRKFLCRILPGGGKIFYHEIVDPGKHGISENDLEEAVGPGGGPLSAGYFPISPRIEMNLRATPDSL